MIVCPKCGKELPDGTKFCSKCGANLAELAAQAAPQDAAPQNAAPQDAAPQDAAPQQAAPQQAAPQQAVPQQTAPQAAPQTAVAQQAAPQDGEAQEATNEKKKKIVKFAAIGVAALVFLFLIISLFSGNKGGKHYAIYLKDKELTYSTLKAKGSWQITEKLAKDSDIGTASLMGESDIYECVLSKDGKTIFFPDKKERSDSGTNLFYRKVKSKKDPVKVDSSIAVYYVNDACNLVTYQKTSSDLYQYKVKKEEKEKIASEVSDFRVSDDGKRVVYRKDTGEVYVWNGKESEKIDSDSSRVNSVNGNVVYYTKDNSLYKKSGSKDKEKILSDVSRILYIYDSGEIYYVKADDNEKNLYYYNGKESEKIAENYTSASALCYKTPVIAFKAKESESSSKATAYVAVKKNVVEFEQEDVTNVQFTENGKTVFFMAEMSKDGDKGELYSASVSSKGIGKATKIDEDVFAGFYGVTNANKAYYFKDCNKKATGDFFYNKKQIDTDVYAYGVQYCEDAKKFVFLTDFNSNNNSGTLKISNNGGKAKKIADDAFQPVALPNGFVLYLSDYSTKSYKGDLYFTKGGKATKLDEDVNAILSFE